ncbi:MAG: hypothetical protein ACXVEE_39850, partial [Polyangiales bacterium]
MPESRRPPRRALPTTAAPPRNREDLIEAAQPTARPTDLASLTKMLSTLRQRLAEREQQLAREQHE